MNTITKFYDALRLVNRVSLSTRSESHSDVVWAGSGQGLVTVSQSGDDVLHICEQGQYYYQCSNRCVEFNNQFSLHFSVDKVAFYRQRYAEKEQWLLDLIPNGHQLVSASIHLCQLDHYQLGIAFSQQKVTMNWSIHGPRKCEKVKYLYYIHH